MLEFVVPICLIGTFKGRGDFADSEVISNHYVNLEIDQGVCLPDNRPKLYVEVRIAEHSFKTGDKPLKIGRCYSWSWKTKVDTVIELPYSSIDRMPDVFIYVRDGDSYLSFKRVKTKKYNNPNVEYEWLNMDLNQSDGKLKALNHCGIICWKFSISDSPNILPKDEPVGRRAKRNEQFYNIYAHIFQCKDLPAADEEGRCKK